MKQLSSFPRGKLPIQFLNPILESIPTRGLPVRTRTGMDAGIVKIRGKNIFFASIVVQGPDTSIGGKLVSELARRITLSGSQPIMINPVVLLPIGTSGKVIRGLLLEISKSAEDHGIIVGKGHTEITSRVNEITLVATIFGMDKSKGAA